MKLQKTREGNEVKITFIPETRDEQLIMGGFRNHWFFGLEEDGTYPEYDGITTEENLVTSMSFKFVSFNK